MESSLLSQLITSIDSESILTETSKTAISGAIKSIYNYVKFKIDPWDRIEYKKKLIDVLKSRQIELVSKSLAKINELEYDKVKSLTTEHEVIAETLKYLQNPVFIEFVRSVSKPSFNWKGGSRKKEKQYYDNAMWWDTFCELMNRRNEEWRAKLLGEALKIQTKNEGCIGYTTLWKIAALPPHSWIDLTQFLSIYEKQIAMFSF